MPLTVQLQSLQDIVHLWVRKWLLKCLNNVKTNHETLKCRKYVNEHLSPCMKQDLLNEVLNIHMYHLPVSNKCAFLETISDSNTTVIDFSHSGGLFVEEVFSIYRLLSFMPLPNLLKLGISCEVSESEKKYIAEINSTVYRSFKQMSNLKWITLTSVGDSELLETIGSSCPLLEYLDVKNSHLVNDESLVFLLVKNREHYRNLTLSSIALHSWDRNSCCSHLTYLGISGTNVTSYGTMLSLILIPNLHSFGGFINEGSISEVIGIFPDSNFTTSLNLTHMWECKLTTTSAKEIASFCPSLIYLSTVGNSISSAIYFDHIRSLVLDCDFKDFENIIFDILEIIGNKLDTLILKDSVNTVLDLHYLIDCASELKELEAHVKWVALSGPPVKSFQKLDKAVVSVNSFVCLENFLVCSPTISCLMLNFKFESYTDTVDSISDTLIIDVLRTGALQCLRHLHVEICGFGDNTMEQLLMNCPNLCCIQGLMYWRKLTKTYLENLKTRIAINNWNICLIMHGNECRMCNF